MKLKVKIHPTQRLAYIPKELYAILGNEANVIPNVYAAVFYSSNISIEKVRRSLQLILADLELYMEENIHG